MDLRIGRTTKEYPVESIEALTFEDWQKIAFTFFNIVDFYFVMLNFLGEMGKILIRGKDYRGNVIECKLSHCDLITFGWIAGGEK